MKNEPCYFILFVLFLFSGITNDTFARKITAKQTGNWSSTSTWNEGIVPVSTDTVMILVDEAVTIIIDVDATVARIELGAGTSLAKKDLLILDVGRTLTVTGNFVWNKVGVFQQNAGSIVTAANYVIGTSGAGYSMAGWNIYGTAGSRASVHGTGNIVGAAPTLPPVQQINWQYANFDITGYIAFPLKNAWDANAYSSLNIDHCYFNQTGYVDIGQYANSTNDLKITHCDFRDLTSVVPGYANILVRTSVLGSLGNFAFSDNVISRSAASMGAVTIYTMGNDREIKNNVFRNSALNVYYSPAITVAAQKSLKVYNNVFYNTADAGAVNGILLDYAGGVSIYDNLFMGQSPNDHIIMMPAGYSATIPLLQTTIRNNVFDIDDGDADVICLKYIPVNILENIFIGNGTPINLGLANDGSLAGSVYVKNNTSYLLASSTASAIAGLAWAGETTEHTGGGVTFINNLIGDCNSNITKAYKDTKVTANLFDYVDYNWFYNGNGGSFITYEGINKPGMAVGDEGFGKYDQAGDPQFYAPDRRMTTFDASLGGPGTDLNLVTEMMKRNENVAGEVFNDAYNIGAAFFYIREGFAPLNATVATAGQGGSWMGAIGNYTNVTWTGTAGTDWNTTGNWSGGVVPTETNDVTVPNVTNNPVISQAPETPAICHNITIEAGGVLTVAAGKALTVTGTFTNNAGNSGLLIQSNASGTGSLITNSVITGTVQRFISNDGKWHFLSSPVIDQPIWPIFAPTPTGTTLTFGNPPWGWDFYYWNPNAATASELYWVNLRQDAIGTYNNWTVDNTGSSAGFGSTTAGVPPVFASGRGYLTAYNANWNPATGSPETHLFSGAINAAIIGKAIVGGANSYNLVGNPYPSAIDWQSAGWERDKLVANSGGYDYWIYNNLAENYGVFNSSTGVGTNNTTRYIAPMQGFFVKASASGAFSMVNVQAHALQTWLKTTNDPENLFRLKLTTSANGFFDEMIVIVSNSHENGGSQKFQSMKTEAPELYSIKNGTNYSIDMLPAVNENSIVALGIKAGLSANYTLDVTGIDNFLYAKNILLEDLKTGAMQELKNNPTYTFSAGPHDNPERFHIHFGGPFGIDNLGCQPEFAIFSINNSVVIRNISGRDVDGNVSICNMLGQRIIQQRITDQNTTLRIEAPAGCYVVSLVTSNQTYSVKVLVH